MTEKKQKGDVPLIIMGCILITTFIILAVTELYCMSRRDPTPSDILWTTLNVTFGSGCAVYLLRKMVIGFRKKKKKPTYYDPDYKHLGSGHCLYCNSKLKKHIYTNEIWDFVPCKKYKVCKDNEIKIFDERNWWK